MNIGRISRVDGISAVATFYKRLQPYLVDKGEVTSAPRINSFVKTNIGLDTVVCQIVGEHEIEYDRSQKGSSEHQEPFGPFLVDLEVRGHIDNGKFRGGLRCLPFVGATVETLNEEDFDLIHNLESDHAIALGRDLYDEACDVRIDANRLMSGHIGIFGNTGSGKSNTLAKLMREYALQFSRKDRAARIVIFDLNNEYGGDAILPVSDKSVFKLSTREKDPDSKIPLNFETLDEDSWGTLLRATQKTQMPVVRRACKRWKDFDENKMIDRISWSLADKRETLFFTLRNYCEGMVIGLENVAFNSTTKNFYYEPWCSANCIDTITQVRPITIKENLSKLNLFYLCLAFEVALSAESGTNYDYVHPLLPRARQVVKDLEKTFKDSPSSGLNGIFNDSNFAVVQLGNTNVDTREMIPALLAELLLRNAVEEKGDGKPSSIISVVIDEAHNLLSYDSKQDDLIHDNTIRVFEKVVKEGRKFGVFLCAASQRPSDISPTITSQIHNFFIHKLVNPNDIERIRKTVSFMGDTSLSMLSALGQGECILSGSAIHMPQYIYVDQLEDSFKPNSDDIVIFGRDGLINNRDQDSDTEEDYVF